MDLQMRVKKLMSDLEDLIEETYDDEYNSPRNDIAEYYRGKRVGYKDALSELKKIMRDEEV